MIDPTTIHISVADHMLMSRTGILRLLMACALGGAVGLEREWRHKDSGLRTNMLICMGAALFTLMSIVMSGDSTPNKGQVAANIVQGIGFLGAGLILHTKVRTVGLTSAATVWVVASIGMTCGNGLYPEALASTAILLVALQFVGLLEGKLGWKKISMIYEVRAQVGSKLSSDVIGVARAEALAEEIDAARHRMLLAILKVLDAMGQRLHALDRDNLAGMERVSFSVIATNEVHVKLLHEMRASDETDQVIVFRDVEDE
jgi:putative Mg2+ transporter-C (MgtC) family protein